MVYATVRIAVCAFVAVFLASPAAFAAQAGKSPVKVFILAGQSNMEGCGAVRELDKDGRERKGTLTYLVHDPRTAALVECLRDTSSAARTTDAIEIEASNAFFGDAAPNVLKKLTVVYTLDGTRREQTVAEGETLRLASEGKRLAIEKALYGDLPDGAKSDVTEAVRKIIAEAARVERWKVRNDVWVKFNERKGGLSVGFGAAKSLFGAELGFGWVVGDKLENQVLIIKTAWGGQSLYADFRPPSSGGKTGPRYTELIAVVKKTLADLATEFPDYAGGGFELAGLVWWHGWNDGCDPKNAVPEYERNLVNLIKDLRKDLGCPRLPVVVGELTGPWVEVGGEWGELRKAQAAAAAHPEFAGNVVFVPTHDFVRPEEDSPGGWPCHEFNNAETYFLVGKALGEGMLKLLGK